jgi:hypothetical protein
MYFQTGDVLYKKQDKLPKGLKKIKGNLIHEGRDHHHLIKGKFELLTLGGDLFIKVKETCQLTHPEHKTVDLPPGIYKKMIVMEYDHMAEESRQVQD